MKLSKEQLQDRLNQFTGCDQYYKTNMFSKLVMTEGVQWLCQNAECFWLIDVICSYQSQCKKDKMLREFQFWILDVDLERKEGIVCCERDTNDVAIQQIIPYTDFPLNEIKLYVENSVICLPSER